MGQVVGKVTRTLNIQMIILYSNVPQGKWKGDEEGWSQNVAEGTIKVPNPDAPAGKKWKRAATKPGLSIGQTTAYRECLISRHSMYSSK